MTQRRYTEVMNTKIRRQMDMEMMEQLQRIRKMMVRTVYRRQELGTPGRMAS